MIYGESTMRKMIAKTKDKYKIAIITAGEKYVVVVGGFLYIMDFPKNFK